jgi:gamma-glutamyltranspeptidase/glutathione hydrolase
MWRNKGVAAVLFIFGLASCSGDDIGQGTVGYVQGFFGAVAADEPNAVLIGRDVLTAGGTAADAAVALYFALSVTLPSVASLGGGGVCLVHDPQSGKVEALDFIAPASAQTTQGATRPSAVPANARGMAALHARYGIVDWRELLVPAERLARFGHPLSRAFTRDLQLAAEPLLQDPESRRIFGGLHGGPLSEGAQLRQLDLAAILTLIRTKGAGEFYTGPLARRIAEATQSAGGSLTSDDLRFFLPRWRVPVSILYGNDVISFAPPPAAVGLTAGQMWQMLTTDDRYGSTPAAERPHLLAEVAKRAFAERTRWMAIDGNTKLPSAALVSSARARQLMATYQPTRATPISDLNPPPRAFRENAAGASFVVVDNFGQAVACSFTMYELFGNGRIAPGTGIVLAASPNNRERNPLSLGPMMISNTHVRTFRLAVAGSGGAAVSNAMMAIAMRTIIDRLPLEEAMNLPRIHHGGVPDIVLAETDAGKQIVQGLIARGHRVREGASLGKFNAIYCPSGLPGVEADLQCAVAHDFRGAGLVAHADE